jgi:hypothetical protein
MAYESFQKQHLPGATVIFVFGALGLLLSFSVGFIFGTIAFLLADRPRRLYCLYPDQYIDYGSVANGRLMGLMGLILNFVFFATLAGLLYGGWLTPEAVQEWALPAQPDTTQTVVDTVYNDTLVPPDSLPKF